MDKQSFFEEFKMKKMKKMNKMNKTKLYRNTNNITNEDYNCFIKNKHTKKLPTCYDKLCLIN